LRKILILLSCVTIPLFAQNTCDKGSILIGGSANLLFQKTENINGTLFGLNPILKLYVSKNYFVGPLLEFSAEIIKQDVDLNQWDLSQNRFECNLGLLNGLSIQSKYAGIYLGFGLGYISKVQKYQSDSFHDNGFSLPIFTGLNILVNDYLMVNFEPKFTLERYSEYGISYFTISVGIIGKIR
jgi:hypothetical protein